MVWAPRARPGMRSRASEVMLPFCVWMAGGGGGFDGGGGGAVEGVGEGALGVVRDAIPDVDGAGCSAAEVEGDCGTLSVGGEGR